MGHQGSHLSCVMKWSVRFLSRIHGWLYAVALSACQRNKKKMVMCVCMCTHKSSQQFCLIEMDRMNSPRPLLPIKRLSCSPSVHTLCCIDLRRADWLAHLHADTLRLTDGSGTQEWLLGGRLGWRTSHQYSSPVFLSELKSGVAITWYVRFFENNCFNFDRHSI